MAQNTGLKGLRDALKANWPEYPGCSVAPNWHTPPPVPRELHDIKAEADAYLEDHPQFYTTDSGIVREVEINGLRNIAGTCAPPPEPYEMTYHYSTTEENTMKTEIDPNSYGKADQIAGPANPTLALQAKAHRQQAERLELTVKAQKKAAKKAKRAERQQQEDIALALDTLVDVAYESDDPQARVEAASRILVHYLNF